ncbi:MAG: radical SAM protein [Elusimicrobiales bacterium]
MNRKWISEQLCISEASFTCNLYCKYCHNPPTGQKNPIDFIINKVSEEKPYAVSLEGRGEPLTNPDIIKMIKEIKKIGVENISISTNAVALSDMDKLKKIIKEVDFLVINFPSHVEKVYNSVTSSVKYKMAVKALENIKKIKALSKVRIFHIISKENYTHLGDFVDWINNNYKDIFLLNFCFARSKGRALKFKKKIIPKYSEVSKYVKLALAKSKLYGIKAVTQNIPLCMIKGFEGFSFELHRWRRGDNVFERGVEEPLKIKKCLNCSLSKGCCGARKDYAELYGTYELESSKMSPEKIKPERF